MCCSFLCACFRLVPACRVYEVWPPTLCTQGRCVSAQYLPYMHILLASRPPAVWWIRIRVFHIQALEYTQLVFVQVMFRR
ncbi:hypothetical protein EDD18DRAFT_168735 [Armillaria luteobubalina]|uniref:Secreted protein n=1 Tax=Armillaria luteobubalina TaxID=153913 RepID=A0AA39TAK3_9AGAR|nr:hypothetical protein EDD18DRAFT_168735 [Armillaria luteobubalina]